MVQSLTLAVSVRIAGPCVTTPPRSGARQISNGRTVAHSIGDLCGKGLTVHAAVHRRTAEVPAVRVRRGVGLGELSQLTDGDIPLRFLFSGTLFHDRDGRPAAARVPWDGEARYRLPASVNQLRRGISVDTGGCGWTSTPRAFVDYRARHAYTSPQEAIESLLKSSGSV